MKYINNPSLTTIKPNWPGTPVDKKNRFVNVEFPFIPKFSDVLTWMFSRNPQKKEKEQDTFRLGRVNDPSFMDRDDDCIVWLGHASFFIRVNRIQMLIDPVFFKIPLVKRYSDHAYSPALFSDLDYLLISHDHRDHCQEKSIQRIASQNPQMKILTGLNMENLLRPWCGNLTIQMAGWYQQYKTNPDIEIYFLPSRHWAKRGLADDNKRLWGAFVIHARGKTVYFSGDTGYGNHFKEVKALFPPISVAIIGVGAYKPEWFMHPAHVSPDDAIRAFHDLEAKTFIPMHYGTFDVSDEPVGEPLRILLKNDHKINGTLQPLSLGEDFTAL